MKKGFTLLFASLIVSLVLSISLAIAHITVTQLILSSSGKESQFAFYNADSGIECALYYEYNVQRSNGDPFFSSTSDTSPPPVIQCGDKTADIVSINHQLGATTTTTFVVNPAGPPGSSCVPGDPSFEVKVHRKPNTDFVSATDVYIESRGYNSCDTSNPRRVERGLYARFID